MKKVLSAILISACLFTFAACGKGNVEPVEEDKQEVEVTTGKEEVEENEAEPEPTEAISEPKEKRKNVLLWRDDRIVLLSGDREIPIYSNNKDSFISEALLENDSVYFFESKYVNDMYDSFFVVCDLDGNRIFEKDFMCNTGSPDLDFMDGKIYISYEEGYQDDKHKVYVYDIKSQELEFNKYYSDALNRLEAENIGFGRKNLFKSLTNDSDKLYAWDNKNKKPVTINRDNLEVDESIDILSNENMNCACIEGDYMLINAYNPYRLYIADLKKKTIAPITEENASQYYLTSEDGVFILYEYDDSEYGLSGYNIYSYDIKTSKIENLYRAKKKPGGNFFYFSPGITGITISNNHIYYMDSDGQEYYWADYDLKKQCLTDNKYDVTPYAYADMLEISSESEVACDPQKDNKVYFKSYIEKPHLKDGFSEYTEKINAQFEEYIEGEIVEWAAGMKDQAYEDFGPYMPDEYESFYSLEWNVTGAKLIGSDYITVEFTGYEYFGGAHGYPYMHQFLFRRSTGEMVDLSEIIGVSKQMYSRIVATKTVEDVKNDTSGRYFLGTEYLDEPSYFEDVLSYVPEYDSLDITYEEDGIKVYFPPYLLGPYSSGYIDVFIGYDELNMKME